MCAWVAMKEFVITASTSDEGDAGSLHVQHTGAHHGCFWKTNSVSPQKADTLSSPQLRTFSGDWQARREEVCAGQVGGSLGPSASGDPGSGEL